MQSSRRLAQAVWQELEASASQSFSKGVISFSTGGTRAKIVTLHATGNDPGAITRSTLFGANDGNVEIEGQLMALQISVQDRKAR